MPLVLNGATSGATTLRSTDATTQTITLPANSGTVITTASSGKVIPTAALPAGTVLQVVQATYASAFSTSSGSATATGLNASITPTSSTSQILVMVTANCRATGTGSSNAYFVPYIYRNTSTQIWTGYAQGGNFNSTDIRTPGVVCYLDSPGTTSSTNYLFAMSAISGTTGVYMNNGGGTSTIILMEIAA